ncbi:MAG: single-stranded DNA-binding protein [Candidatus Gracilibacteria bacterium]|jgi:single-strand DNA-binding protein
MAFSLNRAQVIGNTTRDPETRQTSTGQVVSSFGIATNHVWTDKNGQKQEKAEFHNIVLWGKLAEIAQQYVKKGKKLFVEGRMQTHDWEGEDGQKRSRMEIIGENIIMLDRAGAPTGEGAGMGASAGGFEREQNTAALKQTSASSEAPVDAAPVEAEVALDDLPF